MTASNANEPHIVAAYSKTLVLSRIGRSHTTEVAF
jgi:hypothetical protein